MKTPANLLDVAADILAAEGKPLTVADITDRAVAAGWTTKGKTPRATVESRLAVDAKKGTTSRFARVAAGTYALRAWPGIVPAPPAVANAGAMTYLDAAERVLAKNEAKTPLSSKVITERAIAAKYIAPNGLTPAQTMYVQLMTDVKRRTRRGDEPRFTQLAGGLFGLAEWGSGDLSSEITAHNKKVKAALLDSLKAMKPEAFEALVGELLTALGFVDVVVTKRHHDGGIDVFGNLVIGDVINVRMAVQVKRWKNNVQAPTVQAVRGAHGAHYQSLIVTTSGFAPGARVEAGLPDREPVGLMNGEELVSLLVEHEIGVARSNHDILAMTSLEAQPI
jgi:restriction system protein